MRTMMLAAVLAATMLLPAMALAAETAEVTVKAQGMYCVNCEGRVESALGGLEGVQSVSADRRSETADVVYDPAQVSPEDMVATIDDHTAYVGGLPDEDGDESATAEDTEESTDDGSDSDSDSEESTEVASADFDQTSSSKAEDASVLPMGSLALAGAAVLALAIAGGAWMVVRR